MDHCAVCRSLLSWLTVAPPLCSLPQPPLRSPPSSHFADHDGCTCSDDRQAWKAGVPEAGQSGQQQLQQPRQCSAWQSRAAEGSRDAMALISLHTQVPSDIEIAQSVQPQPIYEVGNRAAQRRQPAHGIGAAPHARFSHAVSTLFSPLHSRSPSPSAWIGRPISTCTAPSKPKCIWTCSSVISRMRTAHHRRMETTSWSRESTRRRSARSATMHTEEQTNQQANARATIGSLLLASLPSARANRPPLSACRKRLEPF